MMPSTSNVAPSLHWSSVTRITPRHRLHLALKPTSQSYSYPGGHLYLISPHRTSNPISKYRRNPKPDLDSDPHPLISASSQLCSCSDGDPADRGGGKSPPGKGRGILTNMWWVDLKAALGQRLNLEGIVSSIGLLVSAPNLALPHVRVRDIRQIDWVELRRCGFKGVVFDKDNTITAPYTLSLWDPIGSSMEQCKSVFGNDIAVFSNSAGLREYDHEGGKARKLENAIGIKVIRHRVKKPAGTSEEIERHFGCKSSQLIMVGDRPFTDIVYGNRNGFLTILTEPLSLNEEPFVVRQVRKLEVALLNYWLRRGLKPISHTLLAEGTQCVKDPPRL